MKLTKMTAIATALILTLAACSGSDDDGATTTAASGETDTTSGSSEVQHQPEAASSFFSIDEIVLDPDGYVALNNFTDVPVTLDGLHLCQAADCFALPDEAVAPGATAYIATGESPDVDGVVITGATIGVLAPPDGELALYVSDPSDPERIITYMEWGSTPHERTEEAVTAGLWPEGSFAPSGDNAVRLYRDPDSGLWLWDAA
jgi:hypothetical protein